MSPGSLEIPKRPMMGRQSRAFGSQADFMDNALGGNVLNPDNLAVADYMDMLLNDETVASGLEFIALSIVNSMGPYENTNKRGQKYYDEMIDRCETDLPQFVRETAVTGCAVGFSVGEKVFDFADGKIWLKRLPVVDPDGWKFVMDRKLGSPTYGQVLGGRQTRAVIFKDVIPADKLAVYSHNSLYGNPYGHSRLKPVYAPYVMKKETLLQWGRTLERYGTPAPVGYGTGSLNAPESDYLDPTKQNTVGGNILTMLQNLAENSAAVLPEGVRLELMEAKTSLGEDFERAQNHFNKLILRGLLIPALLFEPSDIGSFALGKKHFEIFIRSINNLVQELQRMLMREVIAPLLRWNFGPSMPLGGFRTQLLEEEDLKLWSEIFFSLTTAGYLLPELRDDSDMVRNRIGLKPLSDEDLQKVAADKKAARDKAASGQNMAPGQAGDGRRGTDPGLPMATPQAPGKPQGRQGEIQ